MENNNLTYCNSNREDTNNTKDVSNSSNETTQSYPDYQNDRNNYRNNVNICNGYNIGTNTSCSSNGSVYNRLEQPLSPTQALSLMTTVPQNIAARSLGGKHAPTRNSLRHSRMIVMNRNGKVAKKYLPFIIRHYRLVKAMKVLTIILGTLMCLSSILLVLWTPTLRALDFPYWSAAPVLCSGVVGCFFLGFCPRPYPLRKLDCHYYLTKFVSIMSTVVSIMSTIVVLIVSFTHLIYLQLAFCVPHDTLNTTCVCSIANSSLFNESYHYEDLTCSEVSHFLNGILIASVLFNILALVLETSYLGVHWTSQRKYLYAKIPAGNSFKVEER